MARLSTKLKFDERLIHAWKSGDVAAREQVWAELWTVLSNVAFNYCRKICRNDSAAEEMAQDAVSKTLQLIEGWKIEWQGYDSFVTLVVRCLIKHCMGELRVFWRRVKLETSIERESMEGEGESVNLLDYLGFTDESPEDELITAQMKVEGIRETMRLLAAARETCRRASDEVRESTQVAVIVGIEEYVRARVAETLEKEMQTEKLTIDNLLLQADLDDLNIEKEELYQFLKERLNIDRDTLYRHIHHLRKRLKKLREG